MTIHLPLLNLTMLCSDCAMLAVVVEMVVAAVALKDFELGDDSSSKFQFDQVDIA